MADYRCPSCGRVSVDNMYRSSDGPHVGAPHCCATHPLVRMEWIPQVGRMDAAGASDQGGFKEFDTYVKGPDGVDRLTRVSNLQDLRRIERETESAWRDGKGQPMRWRAYANDHSNQDRNTFGETPGDQVRRELLAAQEEARGRRDHLKVLRGAEAQEAARTLGPGVTEESASPLVVPFGPE